MRTLLIGTAILMVFGAPGWAQIIPAEDALADLYPGRAYSPYAARAFPEQVFWGDTHLHTRLSADAGLFGNRLGLEEAYRQRSLLKRSVHPEDIAEAVFFLASEVAAKSTGNVVNVDAGNQIAFAR